MNHSHLFRESSEEISSSEEVQDQVQLSFSLKCYELKSNKCLIPVSFICKPGNMTKWGFWSLKKYNCQRITRSSKMFLTASRKGKRNKASGWLTIVQFDNKRVVDIRQNVSLHLGPHTVSHWTMNKKTEFSVHVYNFTGIIWNNIEWGTSRNGNKINVIIQTKK